MTIYSYKATLRFGRGDAPTKAKGLVVLNRLVDRTAEDRIKAYLKETYMAGDDDFLKFSCKKIPVI